MIEAGLSTYLSQHPVLGPLLVDPSLTRIFPLLIPEHVRTDPKLMPCLIYQRTGATRAGTFCATDTLVSVRLQIDMYSPSYKVVKELSQKVRRALVDYTGSMGDTHVDRVFIDVEFDIFEPDTGLYRVSQSYNFWVQEE